MQGQRDLLGGVEAAVKPHRAALIQHQHGGTLVQVLFPVDLEILRQNSHRGALTLPLNGLHQALLQVQAEVIAEFVSLGVEPRLDADATAVNVMTALPADLQPVEDVVQNLGTDLANPLGGQFQAVALALQVAGLLEPAFQFAQLFQFLPTFRAENGFQRLGIDVLQRTLLANVFKLLLDSVHLLKLVHQVHGLLQWDVGVAAELVGGPVIGGEEVEIGL